MRHKQWMILQAAVLIAIAGHSKEFSSELAPCPNSPNCVSSSATDSHHVDPFPLFVDGKKSLNILAVIIKNLPRTKIIEHNDTYLHAEFESRVFRFVDDLEFLVNEDQEILEVRSASRLGYGDFGVNRKRVEMLRALYLEEIEK